MVYEKKFLLLSAFISVSAIIPTSAEADTFFDYLNGTGSAFGAVGSQPVSNGQSTTNSFTVLDTTIIDELNFPLWVPIGDTALSIEWAITDTPFGAPIASGIATNLPNDYISPTIGGSDLDYDEFFSIPALSLAGGTYWLQLSNATTTKNGLVGWDIGDSGAFIGWGLDAIPTDASIAYVSGSDLPVPSEIFQITGTTTATPEPSTFVLLGTGIMCIISNSRRRR